MSDMELVRVLPSAEDEVNVACFHPFAGGGLVYGTKVCCCWGRPTNGVWFSTLALYYLNYLIDNLLRVILGRKA